MSSLVRRWSLVGQLAVAIGLAGAGVGAIIAWFFACGTFVVAWFALIAVGRAVGIFRYLEHRGPAVPAVASALALMAFGRAERRRNDGRRRFAAPPGSDEPIS